MSCFYLNKIDGRITSPSHGPIAWWRIEGRWWTMGTPTHLQATKWYSKVDATLGITNGRRDPYRMTFVS